VLVQVFGKGRAVVFIGGAMLAAEVGAGRGGVCLLAGRVPRARRAVAVLLRGTSVRVEESGDVDGAVLSAVCKNVYAMALGMADGLGWGSNKKGWLAGRAIGEMAGIIRELGGKVGTAQGTAGTGDLLATGFSPHSHHRRMGQELASNGVMSARSEGAESVPQLVRMLGSRAKQFPLLGIIHSALSGTAARNLMDSYYEKIS
jgi:glycerol-3-phosphate dehydrogenase (NAD(P)+)